MMNNTSLGDYASWPEDQRQCTDVESMRKDYLDWLKSFLQVESLYDTFVADTLYDIPFRAVLSEDANRFSDAWDLREQYMSAEGVTVPNLDGLELDWPITVLDILTILAMKMAYLSDDSPMGSDGDLGYFYREMLVNLGVAYDYKAPSWESKAKLIRKVVDKWMDRKYSKTGSGGLFPLRNPRKDQREVELWYQMNQYMIENH